uniref:Uncharacterized protein n=1 Tax=Knipowitschia caucasica TaxID=637954 RepID=A0AAV2M5Y6_KNICA
MSSARVNVVCGRILIRLIVTMEPRIIPFPAVERARCALGASVLDEKCERYCARAGSGPAGPGLSGALVHLGPFRKIRSPNHPPRCMQHSPTTVPPGPAADGPGRGPRIRGRRVAATLPTELAIFYIPSI